jgi:hypothetical protein
MDAGTSRNLGGPAADRAAYRRFVRTHHPDAGGDPDVFIAGLRRFQAGSYHAPITPAGTRGRGDHHFDGPVVFVRRRRGLRATVDALLGRPRGARYPHPRVL